MKKGFFILPAPSPADCQLPRPHHAEAGDSDPSFTLSGAHKAEWGGLWREKGCDCGKGTVIYSRGAVSHCRGAREDGVLSVGLQKQPVQGLKSRGGWKIAARTRAHCAPLAVPLTRPVSPGNMEMEGPQIPM